MSIIDRRTSQIERKSKNLISLLLMIALATSLMTVSILQSLESNDILDEAPAPAGVAYTIHAPILINDSLDFASQAINESWSGDGSQGTPYIIQGYDINASTAHGILIQNSSVYFIVRDCRIHDGYEVGTNYYGIYLYNCENGKLENNNCSNNGFGIATFFSDGNTFNNNDCRLNNAYGISLYYSSDCDLNNNNCSNNVMGLMLWVSNGSVSKNNCTNNGLGLAVCYSDNSNVLSNNYFSNNGCGIAIFSSSNISTLNNNCSNNMYGILLSTSSNNNIVWNQLCNNLQCGLNISDVASSNNMIWNNTFYHNNGTGDIYDPLLIQAIDEGTNNWWNSTDGYGNYWSDWTTPDAVPPWGIVDNPYNINGTAGAKDYYPQTTAPIIPEPSVLLLVLSMMMGFLLISRRCRKKE